MNATEHRCRFCGARIGTIKDKQTSFTQSFPVMCQHCESPPCVDVCPTGASFRRADGIVLVARPSTQLRPDLNLNTGVRYQGL
jgi:Fe-S-cluster-containing dehydrogenase component